MPRLSETYMKGEKHIAIYHLSIKIISRGKGRSAIAAAAYRAAESIRSEYDGITHDYTRKSGVVHTEILLPEHAPAGHADRATLWNAAEMAERNSNAQLAREVEVALPVEFSREENVALVREYVTRHFVEKGMCADVCVHDRGDGNPHAHILLTMRPFHEDGTWAAKSRKAYVMDEKGERILLSSGAYKTRKISAVDWNEPTKAEEWRAAWAETVNATFERKDMTERIVHRSFERQGIEQLPTIHMGVAASQMEKRGFRTERGDTNREIAVTNQHLRQLRARITKLKNWLDEQKNHLAQGHDAETPALADVLQGLLSRREGESRYHQIHNLKSASRMLNFLTTNGIRDMAGLREKVAAMRGQLDTTRDTLKKNERRSKTLDEHLRQADTYLKHKALHAQYHRIQNPKKREAFYEAHRADLALYEAADRYLQGVMNGRTTLPIRAWKDERDRLESERIHLTQQYSSLKQDTRELEEVRRSVEEILYEKTQQIKASKENVPSL